MVLDHFALEYDDAFEFNVEPTGVMAVFMSALEARGIDSATLTADQTKAFRDASDRIETVLNSDIGTMADAKDLLGDDVDLLSVDNLRTTDGAKLNGVATKDGQIVLDSALTGKTLRDTLVEEIGEAAFYKAFDAASKGDFGAEVEARVDGETNQAVLANFQSEIEADTVMTEYGEAQARTLIQQLNILTDFKVDFDSANATWDRDGVIAANINLINSFDAPPAGTYNTPVTNYDFRNIDYRTVNPAYGTNNPGKYDLNNDGVGDEYSLTAVVDDPLQQFLIADIRPTDLSATSQSGRVYTGKGEVTKEWVLRTEETHSVDRDMDWNVKVGASLKMSGKLFGLGLEAQISVEGGVGATNSVGSKFRTANEVRDTYKIPAGAYEEGKLVSYGFHALSGDIDVYEQFDIYLKITNAQPGSFDAVRIDAYHPDTIKDHYLGLVSTDFDIANAPNPAQFLDIA